MRKQMRCKNAFQLLTLYPEPLSAEHTHRLTLSLTHCLPLLLLPCPKNLLTPTTHLTLIMCPADHTTRKSSFMLS